MRLTDEQIDKDREYLIDEENAFLTDITGEFATRGFEAGECYGAAWGSLFCYSLFPPVVNDVAAAFYNTTVLIRKLVRERGINRLA